MRISQYGRRAHGVLSVHTHVWADAHMWAEAHVWADAPAPPLAVPTCQPGERDNTQLTSQSTNKIVQRVTDARKEIMYTENRAATQNLQLRRGRRWGGEKRPIIIIRWFLKAWFCARLATYCKHPHSTPKRCCCQPHVTRGKTVQRKHLPCPR